MSKRVEILTADQYREAGRAAFRAAMASLDTSLQRHSEVVERDGLILAAGRLEDLTSLGLRETIRDCTAELERRGEATA